MCIVVHRETISFKKTIQGSFSHLILKIFAKKKFFIFGENNWYFLFQG